MRAPFNNVFTYPGVNGIRLGITPVASKKAAMIAGGVTELARFWHGHVQGGALPFSFPVGGWGIGMGPPRAANCP